MNPIPPHTFPDTSTVRIVAVATEGGFVATAGTDVDGPGWSTLAGGNAGLRFSGVRRDRAEAGDHGREVIDEPLLLEAVEISIRTERVEVDDERLALVDGVGGEEDVNR